MSLLQIEELSISVAVDRQLVPVVHKISLELEANQTLGIVGESGCGKSLTALAIMGLLEGSQVRVTNGAILFDGIDLLQQTRRARRAMMGERLAMIFQEPMTSLNPVYRVGEQITESLKLHRSLTRKAALDKALELLTLVQIPEPEQRINHYPHQLSGGQRQRVMIAMALACDPQLLIADEPTTALDVTVQKEILDLMKDLQQRTGTAIVLISHDLGVIAETCNKVAVMYRGQVVESAPVPGLFTNVGHPYTRGLLASLPPVDDDVDWLQAIPGQVPGIMETIPGCAFHPRCKYKGDVCQTSEPDMIRLESTHSVHCHFAGALKNE